MRRLLAFERKLVDACVGKSQLVGVAQRPEDGNGQSGRSAEAHGTGHMRKHLDDHVFFQKRQLIEHAGEDAGKPLRVLVDFLLEPPSRDEDVDAISFAAHGGFRIAAVAG